MNNLPTAYPENFRIYQEKMDEKKALIIKSFLFQEMHI